MYEENRPQEPVQAAWDIHRRLKALPDGAGDDEVTQILGEFRALGLAGEHAPASCVLRSVLRRKAYVGSYSFLHYWHRTFRFSERDRQRYQPPGAREVLSLEEMFRIAVARCWADQPWQHALNDWAEPLLHAWVDELLGNGWVNYHYGRGLLARDRREEAASSVCISVRRNVRAGWAWRNLAQLLAGQEEHEYAVLRHAVALQQDPQYWGEEAGRLVRLLVEREAFGEAVWIVRSMLAERETQGWRVPDWLRAAEQAPWCQGRGHRLDAAATERDAQLILAAVAGDEILEFVIDHQNPEKELAWARCGERGLPLHYRRFQATRTWPVGATGVLVRHDDRAVYAYRSDAGA